MAVGAAGAETSGAAGAVAAGVAGGSAGLPQAGAGGAGTSCEDLAKNGLETDVDCGGVECGPCPDGMRCRFGTDCASGVCEGDVCQRPSCGDAVKNGLEACDAEDLAGATCESLGLGAGTLRCGSGCEFDAAGCGAPWRCGEPLVDPRDGRQYPTLALGALCWMGANLDVGERIDTSEAQSATDRIQKYCWGDDETMCDRYGGLYQWDHAMQYSEVEGASGICPVGWRIATDGDFKELEIAAGMESAGAEQDGWRGAGVGTALKVGGSTGFDAPLGGMVVYGTSYNYPGYGYHWTSTLGSPGPWRRCFTVESTYPPDTVGRWQTWGRQYALAIRCVTPAGT